MTLPRLSPFSWIALLILLYEIEEQVQFPATIRLLENSVCQRHYAALGSVGVPVDETLCKIGAIQHRLATIRGWYSALSVIPMLLLGPLFGRLAEGVGRRVVLALVTVGIILGLLLIYVISISWRFLPTELVMFIVIPRFLGGGPFMAITLHAAMIADISDDNNRSQALYRMFCFKLAIDLVAPQFASLLIAHSLWLPYLLCGLSLGLTLPVIIVLPETGPNAKAVSWHGIKESLQPAGNLKKYRQMIGRTAIKLALTVTFLVQLRYNSLQLLPPYVSVRFGWTISQTAKLLSIVPGISLALYLALPSITHTALQRYQSSIQKIDRTVMQLFCLALIVGTAVIAALPGFGSFIAGLVIVSIGFNIRPPILAVLATCIETTEGVAQIFTLMSITEGLAHLIGSLALEAVWGVAVEAGPGLYTLPFWVLTGCFLTAGALAVLLPDMATPAQHSLNPVDPDGSDEASALLGATETR
ncbi:major facilitator superfamily domain-containing protein [Cercophora newfieldiana]|uniref:Major facilitator superfamily domain-containing protein n=1 Tax=Cercophora newfieldiana TaxID=92897 RepID=A0AA40CPQ0_9PEZI|nr:major facilitator superfamily domain-containing protein [Cercophora newfieldiana]